MNYPLGFLPCSSKEADDAIYYTDMRIASLEAYTRTIDPYGEKFPVVMQDLFDLRAEKERLGYLRLKLNYIEIGEAERLRMAKPNAE